MDFNNSPKTIALQARMEAFYAEHILPNEQRFHDDIAANTRAGKRWTPVQLLDELKPKAKAAELWNLFMPGKHGAGLTNLEYAPLAEITGRVHWAPEVFNCSAPDTGNMEVLTQYGTPEQQEQWLTPLLNGEIRSAFAMTEPDVASLNKGSGWRVYDVVVDGTSLVRNYRDQFKSILRSSTYADLVEQLRKKSNKIKAQ